MPRTIEITIDEDGGTTIEAFDFEGKACQAATKVFEDIAKAMGGTVEFVLPKPEMLRATPAAASNQVQAKGGSVA